MKKILNIISIFLLMLLISCGDNLRVNREELHKINKCVLLTFFHEIWIPDFGSKYFPELIKLMINTPGGYKGYPLLRDGLSFFLDAAKNNAGSIKIISLPADNGLDDLALYRKRTETGKFYFETGNRKIILNFEGSLAETSAEKIKAYLKENGLDAALAVKLNIEIAFKHPYDDSPNASDPDMNLNRQNISNSPAFLLKINLFARIVDKNLKEILVFDKTKTAGYALFSPENGMNLGIRGLFDEFFKFLNER